VIDRDHQKQRRATKRWLIGLAVLLSLMVLVGGLTRLTDSGLSIPQWQLFRGALPPLSDAQWQEAFARYQQIPEYRLQNRDMDLAAFKVIYWWEWGHRQLGRVIGLVWLLGYVGLTMAGALPAGWHRRLIALGLLGGLQGGVGWWMVRSGLEGARLDVASYRLGLHLGLAFAILALIVWYILLLSRPAHQLMQARRAREHSLRPFSMALLGAVFVQIFLGALVAGIDAGRSFTDWPLMGGQVWPSDMFALRPLWVNFLENPALVQFMHRGWGYALVLFGGFVWLQSRHSVHIATRRGVAHVIALLIVQAGLGVATLLAIVPWSLAVAHQALALLLWILVVRAHFFVLYPYASTIHHPSSRRGQPRQGHKGPH